MAGAPPPPVAFRAERYVLPGQELSLSAATLVEAHALGDALAAIDPWARYGTTAANLTGLFTPAADGGVRLAVRRTGDAVPIGVMVIRHPWLAGPYLQFLALLPTAQQRGFGQALLTWFEGEAMACRARNLWVCAASFNDSAQQLYRRSGFERVAVLDDLLKPGVDEVLMRKQLAITDS